MYQLQFVNHFVQYTTHWENTMNEIKNETTNGNLQEKHIHIKKTTLVVFLILFLFISTLILAYLFYAYIYRRHHEPSTTAQSTTQESAYSLSEQKLLLSLTPKVKKAAFTGRSAEIEEGTYIIPGLSATQTQVYGEKETSAICTSMTPQGLTVTPDYLLVSAYCQTQTHNSVIYVIDKHTHQFVKELVLRNRSHVGGLAYDPVHEKVWLCSMSNGVPQVNAISMKTIEKYSFEEKYLPISYWKSYDLYSITRTSFLTYHDNSLYVGYFTKNSSSVLEKYDITEGGRLKTHFSENGWDTADTPPIALPSDTLVIEDQVQGVTFYDNYMLFSHSYGMKSSYLRVYENSYMKLLESDSANLKIRFPSRMEQIYADGDDLYVLFESAAYGYQASSLIQIDRILKLDLKILLENLHETLPISRRQYHGLQSSF